ncbi:hypothetical protein SAMN05660330_04100 [Desulforhopalus singaporensis]|uniref:Uncharacterized protein n=1 Tax=Desulforhopalus singaporensis TaxID=91360 RepID=A0A1H0VJK0_9BACT|nr:hypothetical protein SAMN05660330_04100 [Desulforhopalus singaporensis]
MSRVKSEHADLVAKCLASLKIKRDQGYDLDSGDYPMIEYLYDFRVCK